MKSLLISDVCGDVFPLYRLFSFPFSFRKPVRKHRSITRISYSHTSSSCHLHWSSFAPNQSRGGGKGRTKREKTHPGMCSWIIGDASAATKWHQVHEDCTREGGANRSVFLKWIIYSRVATCAIIISVGHVWIRSESSLADNNLRLNFVWWFCDSVAPKSCDCVKIQIKTNFLN